MGFRAPRPTVSTIPQCRLAPMPLTRLGLLLKHMRFEAVHVDTIPQVDVTEGRGHDPHPRSPQASRLATGPGSSPVDLPSADREGIEPPRRSSRSPVFETGAVADRRLAYPYGLGRSRTSKLCSRCGVTARRLTIQPPTLGCSTAPGIRTQTDPGLSRSPLPVGIERHGNARSVMSRRVLCTRHHEVA